MSRDSRARHNAIARNRHRPNGNNHWGWSAPVSREEQRRRQEQEQKKEALAETQKKESPRRRQGIVERIRKLSRRRS